MHHETARANLAIAIASDDDAIRDRLLATAAAAELTVVATEPTAGALLDACAEDAPAAIVLDLRGDSRDWRDGLELACQGFPAAKAIAILPSGAVQRDIRVALGAGATGLVLEPQLETALA